jgi:release factor glutamine methyltransferase
VADAPLSSPGTLAAALAAIGCVDPGGEARELLAVTTDPVELAALVARRAAGMPLQVVVGSAEFCGLRLHVTDGVFLPRPRSELLAHVAVTRSLAGPDGVVAVDVCCGVGGLASVLATRVAGARVVASDVQPAAVECARVNGASYGFDVVLGDLCSGLPPELRGLVDVIVANVPHVPTGELDHLPRDTRAHEPRLAHDGGVDGLSVLTALADQARDWLRPGGALLVEVADRQAGPATAALETLGYVVSPTRDDDLRTTVLSTTASVPSR